MENSDSIAKSDTITTICQYLFSLQTFQVFPESPNVQRTLLDGPMVDAFGRNLEGFSYPIESLPEKKYFCNRT